MMKEDPKSFGLSANTLKWLAYLAMLLDHIAYVFLEEGSPWYALFRILGRVAAPTMFFFIAEGYYHTSHLRKYIGRLAVMAVVSHIPYALCFGFDNFLEVWHVTSVMWTLLMGLVALTAVDRMAIPAHPLLTLVAKGMTVGLCCLLAYSADWNYIGVLWIVAFGLLRDRRSKQLVAFFAGALLYLTQTCRNGVLLSHLFPLGVFLFLPILFLYNGSRGNKNPVLKWMGYWFYPLHLTVLYLLSRMF